MKTKRSPKGPPTPRQRITEAADKGKGIRLSWDECCHLRACWAIAVRAVLDQTRALMDQEDERQLAQLPDNGGDLHALQARIMKWTKSR